MVVVARTGDPGENRRGGLSLFVVDTESTGFEVGRRLDKIGLKFSDTCEVSFTNVRVPVTRCTRRGRSGLQLPRTEPASRTPRHGGRRVRHRSRCQSPTRFPTPATDESSENRSQTSRTPNSFLPNALRISPQVRQWSITPSHSKTPAN